MLVRAAPPYQPTRNVTNESRIDGDELPTILLDHKEHRAVDEAIAALAVAPDLYQRGGILVRVIREQVRSDGFLRSVGARMIQKLPTATLRERLTQVACFTRLNKYGEARPAHPASWLVSAVDARGGWSGVRHLIAISDAPILRFDGTVYQTPGYDAQSCVLYDPGGSAFPPVHPEATLDDAHAARDLLEDAVVDFPFESDEHKSAWFAALLTPLARYAFLGPSPLFLIDANTRGAGKGLLAQVIGHIVSGYEMPVSSYAHETEEMRKKITATAIAGDRMILLDNLEGKFGNDALDRALTSTRWKDRILGKSELVELPLMPAWYATGNNVQVVADTMRRIIHIRLDCLEERPEERTGFRHRNLIAWVNEHRGQLLAAALTILSAFLRRGARQSGLKPFGSYEGWSSVVREAVVWVGLPDPCLTRTKLAETSDTTADMLQQLLTSMQQYDHNGEGIVVSEMMARLYPPKRDDAPCDEASVAMRAALENCVGCPPGKAPTAKQVGSRLRNFRRRVVGGQYLDTNPNEYHRSGAVWRLYGHDVQR